MKPLSFADVKRYHLAERKSKVNRDEFAKPVNAGQSFATFLKSIPNILAGADLKKVAKAIVHAKSKKLPILWTLGAHVIKVGLTPVIIDLMEQGFVSGLALNGAGIIHDAELAMVGQTSEDVSRAMESRSFGMALETSQFINEATVKAYQEKHGLGETLGRLLVEKKFPGIGDSILAQAYLRKIPVTVHVAIGGDIVHMHPEVSGEAIGAASFYDFQVFCRMVSGLIKESVLVNVGSAVVLPVVIEKAIAVCRNLGYPVEGFIGVNFDFIRHYRSHLNPVTRANDLRGTGYELIGHHELLIPLLALAVKEYAA